MEDLSERISRLSPQQRELLMRRLPSSRNAAADAPIGAKGSRAVWPLSFAQQRLWFLEQCSDLQGAYHMPLLLDLQGPLQPRLLEQSLRSVVARHAVLRTTFPVTAGVPRQHIQQDVDCPLPLIDLTSMDPERQQNEVRRRLAGDVRRRFFLGSDLPWRASLLRLDARRHVLMLTVHHLAADGWSVDILGSELAAFYSACSWGTAADVAPLSIQYADFAAWQQDQWERGAFDHQLDYWRAQLKGFTPRPLPADRPRPSVQTYRGASASHLVPYSFSRSLRAFCLQEGVTLYGVLLATLQILLARYSGQSDVAVGTPVAGRTRAELERLIGCFVNTLVMRTEFRGDPPFRELLARVHAMAVDGFSHEDLPFEKLVEHLRPERDPGRNPLVQVLFGLQNAPQAALQMEPLQARFLETETPAARFDLELNAWETPEGIRLIATYNADLFEHATVVSLLQHLQTLLEGALADPTCRLGSLPLWKRAELHSTLQTWQWVTREHGTVPVASYGESPGAAAPLRERPKLPTVYVPPRTELEREVAQIWAETLNLALVGIQDDFLLLGGDSLLAAQVVRRLREQLQLPLDLRDLFEARTVRDLAAHVLAIRWAHESRGDGGTPTPDSA